MSDDFEMKPVTLKQGMPKAQKNGLFGREQAMVESPGRMIVVVATMTVDEIVEKRIAEEQYPVVAFDHIEVIDDETRRSEALAIRDAEYKARTGQNQLDFDAPVGGEAE